MKRQNFYSFTSNLREFDIRLEEKIIVGGKNGKRYKESFKKDTYDPFGH